MKVEGRRGESCCKPGWRLQLCSLPGPQDLKVLCLTGPNCQAERTQQQLGVMSS